MTYDRAKETGDGVSEQKAFLDFKCKKGKYRICQKCPDKCKQELSESDKKKIKEIMVNLTGGKMIRIGFDKETPIVDDLTFKPYRKTAIVHACKMTEDFEVKTLEGVMLGRSGDYLMMGIAGEFYPCAADIFERSYEQV